MKEVQSLYFAIDAPPLLLLLLCDLRSACLWKPAVGIHIEEGAERGGRGRGKGGFGDSALAYWAQISG